MTSTGSNNITYILKDITFLPYFKERVQAYCSCKSCLNDLFMKLKSRCLICQCSLNFQIKFHKKVKPCSWVPIDKTRTSHGLTDSRTNRKMVKNKD